MTHSSVPPTVLVLENETELRQQVAGWLESKGFAVAQASQCPYCVDSYTQQALEQGLTMQHLGEAMHAAASLRAGITLAHGLVAHHVEKKLSM